MSEQQGWVKDHGFDSENHQRKEACLGLADCPTCGKEIELVADTESWTFDDMSGKWLHQDYSPAIGACCGNLIVDSFEGCCIYSLDPGHHHGQEVECPGCDECPERDDAFDDCDYDPYGD
jgi:hypothetical protein